jgi:DNA-binding winged helix-turn-helix (wHTH) protein
MQLLRDRHRNPRQNKRHGKPRRWCTIDTNPNREPPYYREAALLTGAQPVSPSAAEAAVEFGCFRVLLRRRQLFADGVPVELGTRAFELLLALLEADGGLVTKNELISRVWPGIVVSEENLKVQICALRKALGGDGNIIRTEFGRGYRLTVAIHQTIASDAPHCPSRWHNWSALRSAVQRGRVDSDASLFGGAN